MMKNISEKAEQLLKAAVHNLIRKEMEEWPPSCFGPLYQPKRPAVPQQTEEKA